MANNSTQSLVSHQIHQRHIKIIRQWRISVSSYWRLQPANSTFGPRVRVLLFREVGNPMERERAAEEMGKNVRSPRFSRGPPWPGSRGEIATSKLGRFAVWTLPRISWEAVGSRIRRWWNLDGSPLQTLVLRITHPPSACGVRLRLGEHASARWSVQEFVRCDVGVASQRLG